MTRVRLRSEQIYQAMVDDEAFAELPALLAQSLGARSCVIHWRAAQPQSEIMAHSPYFSASQMADYAGKFIEHDEWNNRGSQSPFRNRVWNCKQLVSAADYERSILYNEWVRVMGDDTFHSVGTSMETGRGIGVVAVHRGKSQADFDQCAVTEIDGNIVHLRRMLTVRARLIKDSSQIRGLTALLDCNPAPMFAVTAHGRIVHANSAGQAMIEAGTMLREVAGNLDAVAAADARQLGHAIARAADAASPEASMVTLSASGGDHVELTFAPVSDVGKRLVLVTGFDRDAQLRTALLPVDGENALAPRELLVARLVAMGLRNRDIAERMGLTEGTVKVYLHNVFIKTGVTTRTELALLIGRQRTR